VAPSNELEHPGADLVRVLNVPQVGVTTTSSNWAATRSCRSRWSAGRGSGIHFSPATCSSTRPCRPWRRWPRREQVTAEQGVLTGSSA
jgi:hypothetical protein